MSGLATWFCRIMGPLLLATLAAEWLLGAGTAAYYPYFAGVFYLVAWVGGYLVWIENRAHDRWSVLPIAFIAVSICIMAVAMLAPVAPAQHALLGDAARGLHALAGLAFIYLGWTRRPGAAD